MYLILNDFKPGQAHKLRIPGKGIGVFDFGARGEHLLAIDDETGTKLLAAPDSPFRQVVQHADTICLLRDTDVGQDDAENRSPRANLSVGAAQIVMALHTPYKSIVPSGQAGEIVVKDVLDFYIRIGKQAINQSRGP